MKYRLFTLCIVLVSLFSFSVSNAPVYAATNINVIATNGSGTPTGINVTLGQTLTIQASGFWCSGGIKPDGSASCGGPEGIRPPDPGEEVDLVLPNELIGKLIGRVGNWVFPIGNSRQVSAQASGQLFLLMNDRICCYADNSGQITATVETGSLQVSIDIKPGGATNPINLKSKGVIPVAILSTSTFDATTVDILSVKFGPSGAPAVDKKPKIDDVNGDGNLDLIVHFARNKTGIVRGDTQACLIGKTTSGFDIQGCDSIITVP